MENDILTDQTNSKRWMQYAIYLYFVKVKLHFVDWHQDPDEVLFVWSNPEQGTEQRQLGLWAVLITFRQ